MSWYQTIHLPPLTPPTFAFAPIWTIIFILVATAALISYNLPRRRADQCINSLHWSLIVAVFLMNAVLNVLWSYLFFGQHLLGGAVIAAGALFLTVGLLISLIWPLSRQAAIFLLPYAAWVLLATILVYQVWQLN